ncbi:MAG TPA: hypothetical protein VGN16_11860 [Acidobacteriaceae bacterium]|jgi:xylan 1,4-beta-xylosidase
MTILLGAAAVAQTPAPTGRARESVERAAVQLDVSARAPGQPLVHFWSKVVGAGRANEGLRATWRDELHTAVEYDGFRYLRFHGLFHDDMYVYREAPDGTPVYNFQYVDDLFDYLLKEHVRPFVELGFPPTGIASVPNTVFAWKANGSPPTDNKKWAALVDQSLRHWIARYGIDEVRQWYFEVWNEPNLYQPFFRGGSQAIYFELYKVTAQTIKHVDPQLRVGGPATSNFHIDQAELARMREGGVKVAPADLPWRPVWVADFLKYCAENNLPVDFISTHPYPQDFALDEPGMPQSHQRRLVESTQNDLSYLRKLISASAYPRAGIELTEWSSSPSKTDHSHDSLAAATFIVKTNLESRGLVDSLSYWVFTDVFEEGGSPGSIFYGGFGLINGQEIVKPAFHAYRFLNGLGDETLSASEGAMVTRDSKTGHVAALFYNYPIAAALPVTGSQAAADAIVNTGGPRHISLRLTHLPPQAHFLLETLDKEHANATRSWELMGCPEPPTREQTLTLKKLAWDTGKAHLTAAKDGTLTIERDLEPWAVLFLKQE